MPDDNKNKANQTEEYVPVGDANLKYINGRGFKAQFKNYWYYYKIHALIAVLLIIGLSISITRCVNKVEPDLSILMCLSQTTTGVQRNAIEQEFSKYTPDVNGDGMVYVNLIDTSFPPTADSKMASNYTQKRFAELSIGNAFIIITDENSFYDFTTRIDVEGNIETDLSIFTQQPFFNGKDNYVWNWENTKFEEAVSKGYLPQDMYFSIRNYNPEDAEEIEKYNIAKDVMSKLIQANPAVN